MDYLHVYL